MVKCPRGTPSQIKMNLLHSLKADTFDVDGNALTNDANDKETSELSEEFELDSNNADKRGVPTAEDHLVDYFVSCILDVLVESWDGKPCYKLKLIEPAGITPSESEEFGEDLLPCENFSNLSNTADYIAGLYKKRSSAFAKEKPSRTISNAEDSEEYNEFGGEDFSQSDGFDPWKSSPDEEVNVVFTNGAWYQGRVSRKLMDGEGTYFWDDGTSYKGGFIDGFATGRGRLDFSCLSIYEGDVYKALRHGEGLHCLHDSPVMYTGQWWLGKKHGEGLMVYSEPSKGHNFYRGHWQCGVKEGFGYRQYPSGAKYIGFWSEGKRHGKGMMIWNNNDIYRGQWKEGLMHGYGEYTWNGFANKTLSYPATNTYRGYWIEGKRHGNGVFETINDGVIDSNWEENLKSGPGKVMCANGTIVTSECLFRNDKQATFNSKDDSVGLLLRCQTRQSKNTMTKDKNEKNSPSYLAHLAKAKAISIPIHSSICSISLTRHIQKFNEMRNELLEKNLRPYPQFPISSDQLDTEQRQFSHVENLEEELTDGDAEISRVCSYFFDEEKYLRNVIASKIGRLKVFYNECATMACEKPPPFKCLLLRLFFWQILIECNLVDSNRSLVDIDDILIKENYLMLRGAHDPFEPIRLGQFIQILLVLSWHLYGRYVFDKSSLITETRVNKFLERFEQSESKCVLRTAFDYLVENDIFPVSSNSKGRKTFFDSDLAPMEAMYGIYLGMGEPLSARDFLTKICADEYNRVKSSDKLPLHLLEGTNALTVTGELTFIPGAVPFNFPEILDNLDNGHFETTSEILLSGGLSLKKVVKCLIQACPGIVCDGYLVNMDHKLTFLEFYTTTILCTELALKLKRMKTIRQEIIEDHKRKVQELERKLSEQEKVRENLVVSGKKSRQVTDVSKAGKK